MKKTVIICDTCQREIPEGDVIKKVLSVSNHDIKTEDICKSCVRAKDRIMQKISTYVGGPYHKKIQYD